jgi:SAM-dependent methyltransferase
MGWASTELSPPSLLFVEFCRGVTLPVADIGAGFGAAALAALGAGATVIANDLEPGHLAALEHPRLTVKPGRFPRGVHFEDVSLAAVHAANVFHFLTGNQLEQGLRAVARWLAPGGRLFVETVTPYMAPFAGFVEEYERRVAARVKWPGWVEKVSVYSSHRQLSQIPRSVHLLDDRVLARAAVAAGLRVERAWLYRRPGLPLSMQLDGREQAGLVAVKEANGGER